MQQLRNKRPLYVVTDTDELLLKEDEARYLKGYRINYNKNGNLPTGTGDGASSQGGNFGIGTPIQSNVEAAPTLMLPAGNNKCIGHYEFKENNESYWFNWNSNGLHGIYRLSGDTLKVDIVYIGSCLNFSIDPRHSLDNRVSIHTVKDIDEDGNRKITSVYLKFVDGKNWHRWIDVIASIKTQGFNSDLFPYYTPVAPHYNNCELINWAMSTPAFCPTYEIIPYSNSDIGKNNNLRNKSLQFAYQFIYSDGRASTLSPYSANIVVNAGGCSDLATNSPRCVRLTMGAGNANVEKIRLVFRNCNTGNWFLYDTIEKYQKCQEGEFFERQKALEEYDEETNTFKYNFCGDKECALFSNADQIRVQNDIPITSYALTPVGDAIILVDNLYGYDNFDCETLENIKVEAIPGDESTASCSLKTVTIRAYTTVRGAPICRITDENGNVCLPRGFATNYGGNSIEYPCPDGVIDNKQGLIGYLAGTPYAVIGEQYRVTKDGQMDKVGILDYFDPNVKSSIENSFREGAYYVQRYEFTVPAGTYIFRVASHHVNVTDVNYQETSTFIYGKCNIDKVGSEFLVNNKDFTRKELFLEACSGDLDTFLNQSKLVLDFDPPFLLDVDREKWFQGYIKDTTEVDAKGIELLEYMVTEGFPDKVHGGRYTDHNGFYFISVNRGGANNAEVVFWGEYNCQMTTRQNPFLETNTGKRPRGQKGFSQNISIQGSKGTYQLCNEVRVKGKISDSSGNGVAGVSVVITRGGATLTNAEGEFTLKVHRGNIRTSGQGDKILFNSLGGCALVSSTCDCLPVFDYNQPVACVCPGERVYPINIQFAARYINTANRGLKGGGRYGFAVVGHDTAGRQTFANNFSYLDIPTFLETGIFNPVQLRWSVNDLFALPKETSYLSFYRTSNLNYGTYIQWVADKIQFLNARGEEVTTSDEAVRTKVYFQSLLDFNKENSFATTVGYQFVAGDILRIYDDGDGNLFRVNSDNSFMDYPILGTNFNDSTEGQDVGGEDDDVDGKSFIITYDKRLDKLKDKCGFWIEIIRPHQCEDKEIYYEICGMYPVQDGKLLNDVTGGVLETWDTYYQNRIIRPKDCAAKTISHPFESASVTDFWGDGCSSNGRVSTVDPQAEQRWYGSDVIKSDDFVNEGRVNGLGTFRESNRKDFKGQEDGDIIFCRAEQSIIAFICQNDWFLCDFNMNFLRVTNTGLVAANTDSNLSEPHQKVGNNFGCEFEDNSSIVYDEGIVFWADRKNNAVIAMDYRQAADISAIDNSGYFNEKFRYVTQHNNALREVSYDNYLQNLVEIVAGKDTKYGEYIITFRPRRGLTTNPAAYVNNEREIHIQYQESITFNIIEQRWVRFENFTPERFGLLRKSISGKEMITFKDGRPYFHNSNNVKTFLTYYGIETDQVLTLVENFDPSKVKVFQSVTVESNGMKYFADMIYTNERYSFSCVPLAYWTKKEGIYYSHLLQDMNTYPSGKAPVSMLVDGKRIFGTFMVIRLVRDTNNRGGYNELNNVWIRIVGSEKSEK